MSPCYRYGVKVRTNVVVLIFMNIFSCFANFEFWFCVFFHWNTHSVYSQVVNFAVRCWFKNLWNQTPAKNTFTELPTYTLFWWTFHKFCDNCKFTDSQWNGWQCILDVSELWNLCCILTQQNEATKKVFCSMWYYFVSNQVQIKESYIQGYFNILIFKQRLKTSLKYISVFT